MALVLSSALALAACGSSGGGTSASLTAIAIETQPVAVARGASVQLRAVGSYSDGTSADLTARSTWTCSDTSVAIVTGAGRITGISVGAAAVSARAEGVTGTAPVTVTLPAVAAVVVTPGTAAVAAGGTLVLAATARRADGRTEDVTTRAAWSSSSPAEASVSASGVVGVAAGAGTGATITIAAAFGGQQGASVVTVVQRIPIGPARTSDPMALQQWYLVNTGQDAYADLTGVPGMDMRLSATYAAGWSGAGVKVAVVDSGLEIAHEDLAANVVPGSWNYVNDTSDPSPDPATSEGDHGTSVAGVIGMVYDNGKGGMGVAPGAGLNGYNFIALPSLQAYVASLGQSEAHPASSDAWIFNQSFGMDDTVPVAVFPLIEEAFAAGVATLRGGRGAVYVKSAGNGFEDFGPQDAPAECSLANALGVTCQNASMDGYNTLPYNLVVGALNASGVRSSYSTAGSALWVSAPGGEYGLSAATAGGGRPPGFYAPAMVTTDRSGCVNGYSFSGSIVSPFNRGDPPNTDCSYTSRFNGTSSAAPALAGAVALLLQARPTLTWREVKHLLASTAWRPQTSIAPVWDASLAGGPYEAELPWIRNAAGYSFHNWYGFGVVDVDQAVAMAQTWTSGALGTFENTGWIASAVLALPIPDGAAAGASSSLAVPATPRDLVIEAVQVDVTVSHPSPGDLGIELTSPSGTRSILLNIKNGLATASGLQMVLASNAFYGERAAGGWTLKVVDGVGNALVGTLSSWSIRIYGH